MKNLLASLLVAASLLFTGGCSTPSPIFSRIAQKAEEQKAAPVRLFAHGVLEVLAEGYRQTGLTPPAEEPGYVDGVYIFPNEDMLNAMDEWVIPRQYPFYVSDAFDCDDAGKLWCILTHLWWVEVTEGQVPVALATFVVYVEIEAGAFDGRFPGSGGHALGLLCDSDGVWWYVEPSAHWHVKCEEALYEGNIVACQIVW